MYKKRIACAISAPESNFFVLLLYTQFFMRYKGYLVVYLCLVGYNFLNCNFAVLDFDNHFCPAFGAIDFYV